MRNIETLGEVERGNDLLTLTADQACQGETSGHVRMVLAVSLSSAFILLATLYFIFF